MTIRAVCFDLDGLMFNTESIYDDVGMEVLRRRGYEFTPELKNLMMGRRAQEALAYMISHHSLTDSIEQLRGESLTLFFELAEQTLAPMPGLFELLSEIEQRSLPKGVATSSERYYLERVLGRYELLPRFKMTLTAEDVTHGKPDPEIYIAAAKNLGVQPGEMLVLEDSQNGINAAAAAGAVAVAIPHAHCIGHDYSRATYIAQSLHDPVVLGLLS